MQDKYVGDIGDFGKFGFLRYLFNDSDIALGINWYKTMHENQKNDGNKIDYLQKSSKNDRTYRSCDPVLYDILRNIVAGGAKSLAQIENSGLFKSDTIFFSGIMPGNTYTSGDRIFARRDWFSQSLRKLENCDAVFADPDNAIEKGTLSHDSMEASKYMFYSEISTLYKNGKSVIVYNHRSHEKEEDYLERYRKISSLIPSLNQIPYLRFHRVQIRDYIFILQHQHEIILKDKMKKMVNMSPWIDHFTFHIL